MFIDKVKLKVTAGDGGNGMIAFRREKYIDKGGPSGGDGGRGGNVFFIADSGLNTLLDFKFIKEIKAKSGENGKGKLAYGKSGEDLYVKVPVGTIVFNEENKQVIADFKYAGQTILIAKGGRGGRGNAHFATSVNQVPRVAENGAPGEAYSVIIELKLLADVGLVGFPSVGKSSIISAVSAAKPEIANYPFTTITPHLGMVKIDDGRSFIMSDLPGLIEGASQGKGLGLQFLRHIERCRVLVHVVDISVADGRDPVKDFEIINNELKTYNMRLLDRPMIIAANKMDDDGSELILEHFKANIDPKYEVFPISALQRTGLKPLLYRIADLLSITKPFPLYEDDEIEKLYVYSASKEDEKGYVISRPSDNVYVISGNRIERLYKMTNISTDEGLMYFTTVMRRMGIENELRQRGIKNGDIVRLLDFEFEYFD